MKIGVFIGSFNPPHVGHEKIMQYLLEKKYVDKILLVPTGNYWDKNNLLPLKERINLLKFYENKCITVETEYNNCTFTYELMRNLNKKYISDELFLIMGADNIVNFTKWQNYEELLEYPIIVMNRNHIDITKYTEKLKGNFLIIKDYPFIDISSSQIRENIRLYQNYLKKEVYKSIIENKLYGESYE